MAKSGGPSPSPDMVQAVVADANQFGLKAAAEKWGITIRTVSKYKKLVRANAHMETVVITKTAETLSNWDAERMALIKAGAAKLMELIPLCDPDHIHPLVGMLKILGELEIVNRQLALDPVSAQSPTPLPSPAGLWRIQLPPPPDSDS